MLFTNGNPKVFGWSLEYGYGYSDGFDEYPMRVVDSGKDAALDVGLMLSKRNFDYQCKGFDQGFRVILSMPGEELQISRNSLRVPVSESSLITIRPKLTVTTALQSISAAVFLPIRTQVTFLQDLHESQL